MADESKANKSHEGRARTKDDPAREARTVFVGNIASSLSKKEVRRLFNEKLSAARSTPDPAPPTPAAPGLPVETIRVRGVAPRQPGMPKRVAAITGDMHPDRATVNMYIVLRDRAHAESAVATLNGAQLGGRHLRVDFSSRPTSAGAVKAGGKTALAGADVVGKVAATSVGQVVQQHDHRRSVFMGNLPFDADEEDVRRAFEKEEGMEGSVDSVRIVRDAETGLGRGFGYVLLKDADSVGVAISLAGQLKVGERVIRMERSKDTQPSVAKKSPGPKKGSGRNEARPKNKKARHDAAQPFAGAVAKPRGAPGKAVRTAKSTPVSTRRKRAEAAGVKLLSKKEKSNQKAKKLQRTLAKQKRREGKREK